MKLAKYLVMSVVSLAATGAVAVAQTSGAALFAPPSQADIDADVALLRADLQTQNTAIIKSTMQFTDDQSKAFWPLYQEYSAKQQAIGDQRVAIIKDYADQYANLTDAQADALEVRQVKFEKARAELAAHYYSKFKKAVGAKQAAKFYQVESRLRLVRDLQISSAVPIIQ